MIIFIKWLTMNVFWTCRSSMNVNLREIYNSFFPFFFIFIFSFFHSLFRLFSHFLSRKRIAYFHEFLFLFRHLHPVVVRFACRKISFTKKKPHTPHKKKWKKEKKIINKEKNDESYRFFGFVVPCSEIKMYVFYILNRDILARCITI